MISLKSNAVVAFASFLVLAACQPDEPKVTTTADGFTVRELRSCGTERVGALSLYRESPVTNEGNGYVGFATEEQNATGVNYQRYSLVNCATRTLVKVESTLPSSGAADVDTTLFQRVDRLRNNSRLANENLFEAAARENGYDVTTGVLPAVGSEAAKRADCGCRRFYWDTVENDAEGGLNPFIVE